MLELKGLATGIGSLPHKDAQSALDLVFKYTPRIPFWPQLPKIDMREGMVAQFSEGLPCIKVTDKGIFFNPENKQKELEKFYEKSIASESHPKGNIDYFRISSEFASGLHAFYRRLKETDLRQVEYIKCQITGPFTFAASIKDDKGVALLYDYEMMQAISKGMVMKALWQVKFFEEFGKKIIVFIDEPYLGSFGSAYTPINREEVVNVLAESGEDFKEFAERLLSELAEELISAGTVLLGIHCCGNTDWSIFTDINTVDIISFDAFGYLDKLVLYADDLKQFFDNERILCWGVVPTQEFNDNITQEELVKKINAAIDVLARKGVNRDKLSENLLLSPACGLGTLDMEKSEKIFKLLSHISERLRK